MVGWPSPELLREAASGNEQARERLLMICLPVVLGWCNRLGGPRVDPEDAAQDVAMTVLRRLDSLEDPSRFTAWLFGVTRRVLSDHRQSAWSRRRSGAELPEHPSTSAMDVHDEADAKRRVRAALDELPEDLRVVLVLCFLEERTQEDVADILELARGTVASRLRRARQCFKEVARARGLYDLIETKGEEA